MSLRLTEILLPASWRLFSVGTKGDCAVCGLSNNSCRGFFASSLWPAFWWRQSARLAFPKRQEKLWLDFSDGNLSSCTASCFLRQCLHRQKLEDNVFAAVIDSSSAISFRNVIIQSYLRAGSSRIFIFPLFFIYEYIVGYCFYVIPRID